MILDESPSNEEFVAKLEQFGKRALQASDILNPDQSDNIGGECLLLIHLMLHFIDRNREHTFSAARALASLHLLDLNV